MIKLTINGREHELNVPEDMPLLWVLRDVLHLTGTKFGCGMALCGACTVHVNGEATRSCITPVAQAKGKSVSTIEAMSEDDVGQKVQQAWLDYGVAQCGYCQSGQIMNATALLKANAQPSDAEITSAMNGNICRCGTYNRIQTAIEHVVQIQKGEKA